MRFSPRHPAATPAEPRWSACDTARCTLCGGVLDIRCAALHESAYPGLMLIECRACGAAETPAMRGAARAAYAAERLARKVRSAATAASSRSNAARTRGNQLRSALFGLTMTSICRSARCGRTISYEIIGRKRLQSYCDDRCRAAAGNDRETAARRARALRFRGAA